MGSSNNPFPLCDQLFKEFFAGTETDDLDLNVHLWQGKGKLYRSIDLFNLFSGKHCDSFF